MSFTNDTDYPLLIRGMGWRNGGSGYVKFEIYSVPNGRKVSFATGPKRNYRSATDTVQYTSSLPAGSSKRIEYPVDGFQVTVIRTVRERSGQGHPPEHLVLELRADHRRHADRPLRRPSSPPGRGSGSTPADPI